MDRGEVVWVDLGNPPGGSGREQGGDRPAVIISKGSSDPRNPMITMIPLTCQSNANRFPYTVDSIQPSKVNGLSCISVALIFQIRSLDKKRVRRIAGNLEEQYMKQIEQQVRNLLLI